MKEKREKKIEKKKRKGKMENFAKPRNFMVEK
jgi:hypothetical protein